VDFEALYRTTFPRVLAYARSVASPEDADDAVAEAYAIAWRRQRDIPRSAELGWLIGVTRRVLANTRRSRRRAGALHALLSLQPQAPGPDPAERVEDGELRTALLALSPLDREAVLLTAWFDLSSADAAQALGARGLEAKKFGSTRRIRSWNLNSDSRWRQAWSSASC
jgi:DNA-directed RNA polymerase specialized sigma24 family protein